MRHYIQDLGIGIEDELQNTFKTHYMGILDTIRNTGSYTPPRPTNLLKRILLCQNHNFDYIFHASIKVNSFYIKKETYIDICNEYIAAFDECSTNNMHANAVLIRKYLIELLSLYVQSCTSVKDLEPQRTIVQRLAIA